VFQVISEPRSKQVVSDRRRDNPEQLSLEGAHFDLLAIGAGLETARIGLSLPRGWRSGHNGPPPPLGAASTNASRSASEYLTHRPIRR
jgi:hypothetical protein